MSHKRIVWKSWNFLADSYMDKLDQETMAIIEIMSANSEDPEMANSIAPMSPIGHTIHTPLGIYPLESMFKPSDRWDCWIGTTNFGITNSIENQLEHTDGIEC